ncbi:MAG: LTA synthase family protein [Candidatus Aminicenantia bacterium]
MKQKLWNIIIIDIESLGAEIINKRIDGKEITPTLNKFAREGIYFPNFYSQALTCSGTLDVELSSLTTLYPSSKSPYAIKYAKNIPSALTRFLNQHGYKTMFFHANSEDFYRRGIVLRIFGFKELYFSEYFKSPERKYRGTDDYPFFLECAEVLKKSKQPFFAFILTLSSHNPFDLPKGEKPQLEIANSNLDETTKRYFQIMNYVDKSVKAFVESIGVKSLLENSILIIFGDHPRHYPEEGKGEMEIVRDAINKKVPLIIFNPSFERKEVNELGSHVEITPTILSVLGLKYDGVLLGRNLLSKGEGFVIINRSPVVIIKGKNYFWGYLENGLLKYPIRNERTEIEEANKLMEILRYSEYTLKK